MKLLLNVKLLLKKHMLLKPSMAVALVSVAATQAVNMAAQLSELPEAMVGELRLPGSNRMVFSPPTNYCRGCFSDESFW